MKISIITVTYNSARTLSRAVSSVLQQDWNDIEYILIDGASQDGTVDIIRDFARQHPSIRYISEPDKGIYDAINKGIRMATGDVIGVLNSDDELANEHVISDIAGVIETKGADIVYGDLLYCRYDAVDHAPKIVRYWKSNAFNKADLHKGWMPPHPTLYCRKEVFEHVGLYRDDFRISADYEFILRVFERDDLKKVYLPQVLVQMETGGISNRNLRTICLKMREDMRAMQLHRLHPLVTILWKNISKLSQFIRR